MAANHESCTVSPGLGAVGHSIAGEHFKREVLLFLLLVDFLGVTGRPLWKTR